MQPHRSEAVNKELAERNQLLRAWRQWHREQLQTALDGRHGSLIAELMARLKRLSDSRDLLAFIAAKDWRAVDFETRLICLHEIGQAIVRHRIHAGLAPFDDLNPPLNAFHAIKRTIFPAT